MPWSHSLFARLSFLVITLLFTGAVQARSPESAVELYDRFGHQIADYASVLGALVPGHELCFGVNCEFRFVLLEGKWGGMNNTIFKAKRIFPDQSESPPVALRLAKSSLFLHTIGAYIKGHQQIAKLKGVVLPELYFSYEDQFAAVELIDFEFKLKEFFLEREKFPHGLLVAAENALYEFAIKTAHVETLGDFHDEQLVYQSSKNRWVDLDLVDWNNYPRTGYDPGFCQHLLGSETLYYSRAQIKSDPAKYRESARVLSTIDQIVQQQAEALAKKSSVTHHIMTPPTQ